jgi:hypothetical protein
MRNKFGGGAPMPSDSQSGDRVLVFKEHEGKEGEPPRTIGFTDFEFKPLGFEDLLAAPLHKRVTIPLEIFVGKIAHTNIKSLDISQSVNIKTELQPLYLKGDWSGSRRLAPIRFGGAS